MTVSAADNRTRFTVSGYAKFHQIFRENDIDLLYFNKQLSKCITQGSKLRGAKGQNAPKLSPNAPSLWNLGAKFCFPIQPDICFEALQIAPVTVTFAP